MEEKPELLTQVTINNEEEEGGGVDEEEEEEEEEEFYEKIEAPKFVDFTAPDPYRPDDRYWFCLRVGCDQKHEEEIDPEAISKNFVLRVMAARSPYIRLRQILNRKASSVNEKCPLSAPPKPSKSRVSKLAVISTFSQKMVDGKGKSKPISKLTSTPNAKGKQVAAKYLTTPRNKNCLPNPNSFRSVQNPRPPSVVVPKNRTVAKALFFHSPKKGICVKTSSELRTPLAKICEGMKRLEITGQRKRVLGYSNKSSKEMGHGPKNLLLVDLSRRQLGGGCKDKNKANELIRPAIRKEQEMRSIKRKSKWNSNKPCKSASEKTVGNKPREGSVLKNSGITEGKVHVEQLGNEKTSGSFDSIDSTQEQGIPCSEVVPSTENSDTVSSEFSRDEKNSSSKSEEGCLQEKDFFEIRKNSKEGNKNSEGNYWEEKSKARLEKRESSEDHQMKSQTLGVVGHEDEAMDSDDKENALASGGDRRDFDPNNNHSGREILGKQETSEITKKVVREQLKNLKVGLIVASTGAEGVKYKKSKPTNPKPFRLRTNERGILKEATLERRMQALIPQNETATVSMPPARILHKRQGNEILQRYEKSLEPSKCNHNAHETSGKKLDTNLQNQRRAAGLRTPKAQVQPRKATITPQRPSNSTQRQPKPVSSRFLCGRDVTSQQSENNLRKAKLTLLQGQAIRPKGVASMRKAMTSDLISGKQLAAIKETMTTPSRSEEAREPSHCKDTSTASRLFSSGKRPTTIPKEPNF